MKRHAPKTPLSSEPTLNCLNSLRNRDRLGGSSDSSDLGRARGRLEAQTQRGNEEALNGRGGGRGGGRVGGRGRRSDDQSLDSRNRLDNVQEGQDQINSENNQSVVEIQPNEENSNNVQESLNKEEECFSVQQMIDMAKRNIFPSKNIFFDGVKKKYTPVLHFFKHHNEFNHSCSDKTKIIFECKVEKCKLHEELGATSNLNKHLKLHKITANWYESYKKHRKTNDSPLTDAKLNLVKFFITSNLSLKQLENVHLRNCLKDEIKLPCMKTFQFTYLKEVLKLMHNKIEEKCKKASFITIIPDMWSDLALTHYLGL